MAKQYFSDPSVESSWNSFLASNNLASSVGLGPAVVPNGPFPTGGTGTPPTNYPDGPPFTNQINITLPNGVNTLNLQYTFGLFNPVNPANASESPYADGDRTLGIYSRCVDVTPNGTKRSRSVSAILSLPLINTNDYLGVDGHGFRNQGNFNN